MTNEKVITKGGGSPQERFYREDHKRHVCPLCEGQGVVEADNVKLYDYLYAVLDLNDAFSRFYCKSDESARATIRKAIEILKTREIPCGECKPLRRSR